MSNTQQIRRRIKSITNTRQITKAMELVAAAKMRKAQELTLKSRNFSLGSEEVLRLLQKAARKTAHPLLLIRNEVNKIMLIVMASDKGLAGSYNANILRKSAQYINEQKVPVELMTIGKKAQNFFSKTDAEIVASFSDLPPYPTSRDIKPIIDIAISDFLSGKVDKVVITYTKFHSTIKQEVLVDEFLPIVSEDSNPTGEPTASENIYQPDEYKFEPDEAKVLDTIVPGLVEISLYQKVLDSIASEHSSRMVAMKNASDNAKDIIDDLQLTYNSVRQASITQELAEITAGANAI